MANFGINQHRARSIMHVQSNSLWYNEISTDVDRKSLNSLLIPLALAYLEGVMSSLGRDLPSAFHTIRSFGTDPISPAPRISILHSEL